MSTKHIRCASDLGRFKAYLQVTCSRCQHSRTLDAMDVAQVIGTKAPVNSIVRRLKCILCGSKAATCTILHPPNDRRLPRLSNYEAE